MDRRHIQKRSIFSWVLVDISNTIFSVGMLTLFFPLWLRNEVGGEKVDSFYGIIVAASIALIFFFSPLLGSMTDYAKRRVPFLMGSTFICLAATLFIGRFAFGWSCFFFVLANVSYQAGLQFYDSLLAEVSNDKNRGRVSGLGIGIGFLGAPIAGAVSLWIGIGDRTLAFLIVPGLYLFFAAPCFLFLKEKGNPNPRKINFSMVRASTMKTGRTLRDTRRYKGLVRFLVGRAFYLDAINTAIGIVVLYMINIAIRSGYGDIEAEKQAKLLLMMGILFAMPSAILWGKVTDRYGPKRALEWVLTAWMIVFAGLAFVGFFEVPFFLFFVGSIGAGIALGGVGAVDRPFLLQLAPPDRVGEFYGLYGMVGRLAAVAGPALWAGITYVAIEYFDLSPVLGQAAGIVVFLIMTAIGYFILRPVSDRPFHLREEYRDVS